MKRVLVLFIFVGLCSFEGQGQSIVQEEIKVTEKAQRQKINVFPNPAINV